MTVPHNPGAEQQTRPPQTPRTARMMMGEILEMAEKWVVAGLPSLVPPRVDQTRLQERLEEMIEQARSEARDTEGDPRARLAGYFDADGGFHIDEADEVDDVFAIIRGRDTEDGDE